MRLAAITLLLSLSMLSFAQVRVLNKELNPVSGVQLLSADNKVISISDAEGLILFDTAALEHTSFVLYHEAYHPVKLNRDRFLKERTIILTAKTSSFDPVVIYPTRSLLKTGDVALNMESIDHTAIQLFQPSTSADLLAIDQKVYVQKSQQGGGSPMIRGFATNRILLVVDGVRMNNAIFRSGNLQNVISIDPFSIQTTEVIFGPGSQLYGSDAIGGVLHFKTRTPQFSDDDTTHYLGAAQIASASANDQSTAHFDFEFQRKRFASYTSVTVNRYGDLRMGSNGPDFYTRPEYIDTDLNDSLVTNRDPNVQVYSGYDQVNLTQKLHLALSNNASLIYGLNYSTTTDIPRYDRLIQYKDGDLVNAEWYYGPQEWLMSQLILDDETQRSWSDELEVNLAYQHFEESRNDRKIGKTALRRRSEEVDAISANIDIIKHFQKRNILTYGGEFVWNGIGSTGDQLDIVTGDISPVSTRYPDGSNWSSAGIYINMVNKWTTWYKTEGGLRYNQFMASGVFDTAFLSLPSNEFSLNNGALTGSLSHLFKLKKGTIGITTSTAFRSPNIDDIAKVFDSNPGQVILPNPELQSEYAYNAEINYNYTFHGRFKFSTTAFYTYLNNSITNTLSTYNGADSIYYDGVFSEVRTLSNTDYAKVYGIQLSLEWKIDSCLTLFADHTVMNSSSSDGSPIRHITPNFGGVRLQYIKGKWTILGQLVYQQEFTSDQFAVSELGDPHLYVTDENGELYAPAWGIFNTRMQYNALKNVTIGLNVENWFDKRYRPYRSGITAPGRNVQISVRYQFMK